MKRKTTLRTMLFSVLCIASAVAYANGKTNDWQTNLDKNRIEIKSSPELSNGLLIATKRSLKGHTKPVVIFELLTNTQCNPYDGWAHLRVRFEGEGFSQMISGERKCYDTNKDVVLFKTKESNRLLEAISKDIELTAKYKTYIGNDVIETNLEFTPSSGAFNRNLANTTPLK